MGKQPTTGQKKSKDSIAKAASQSKGPAKVIINSYRNGIREKLKKRLIMQYFLIDPHMIDLLQASLNLESTSQFQELSKNSKSSDQLLDNYSDVVLRMDHYVLQKATANKPSTLQSLLLKQRLLKLNKQKPNNQKDKAKRNKNDIL
jgi:hypothetical protein